MLQFIGLGALVVLLAYCSQTITRAVDRPEPIVVEPVRPLPNRNLGSGKTPRAPHNR